MRCIRLVSLFAMCHRYVCHQHLCHFRYVSFCVINTCVSSICVTFAMCHYFVCCVAMCYVDLCYLFCVLCRYVAVCPSRPQPTIVAKTNSIISSAIQMSQTANENGKHAANAFQTVYVTAGQHI